MTYPFFTGQVPTAADFNQLAVKADLAGSSGASQVGYGATTVAAALAAVAAPTVTSVAGRVGAVTLAVADVAGAAALNGSSAQNFSVATATGPAHAVPLAQADARYAAIGGGGGGGTPPGFLNVTSYGVNGTASDATNMAIAINAAITTGKKLYAPAMTIAMGATTLVFPPTLPVGFTFECDPGNIIQYTGSGDAITIDSAGFSVFKFGGIVGSGGVRGIRIKPTSPNANFGGQTATVACAISFNTIMGFYRGIHADNSIGNVAQNNINGLAIISGQGGVAAGSMTGNIYGVIADGRSGGIYQGNIWNINYIEANPASFNSSATWIGIQDGDATLGDSNNVNTYQFGAIDGIGFAHSYGVNTYGNRNLFIGPIVDIHVCMQLGSTAFFISLLAQSLSTMSLPGDYQILDGSSVTTPGAWHWSWVGALDGLTGNLVSGMPTKPAYNYIIGTPSSYPTISSIPTTVPVVAVGGGGSGLSNVSGGLRVANAGYYTLKAGLFINTSVGGNGVFNIGIGINGPSSLVAISTYYGPGGVTLSTGCDVYLSAGDIVYLGGACSFGGFTSATQVNFLSVVGPL